MFDVLMKYDAPTGKYIGGTAESLTSNADFTEWTMKLRPNIKFNDGTPYDAAAVKWVLERQMLAGNSAPRSQLTGAIDAKITTTTPPTITDSGITVVDPLTLKFRAKTKWVGFPYIFVGVNGLIYSKAAFEKARRREVQHQSRRTAGAGPFMLKSYKPGEVIEIDEEPELLGRHRLPRRAQVRVHRRVRRQPTTPSRRARCRRASSVIRGLRAGQGRQVRHVDMPTVAGNIINMNSGIQVTCAGAATAAVPACQGVADGTKVTTKTATSNMNVRSAVAAAVDPESDQRPRLRRQGGRRLGAVRQLPVGSESRGPQGRPQRGQAPRHRGQDRRLGRQDPRDGRQRSRWR